MPSNDSTLTCKTKDSTVAVCVAQTGVGVLYFYVSSLLCICTLLIPRKCDVCIVINSRRTIQLKVACSYCLIMLAAFIAKSAMASVHRSRQHTYRDSPGAESDSVSIHFSLTISRTGILLVIMLSKRINCRCLHFRNAHRWLCCGKRLWTWLVTATLSCCTFYTVIKEWQFTRPNQLVLHRYNQEWIFTNNCRHVKVK